MLLSCYANEQFIMICQGNRLVTCKSQSFSICNKNNQNWIIIKYKYVFYQFVFIEHRYTCCGGYMPCSGRCGESKCPTFCLCTEVQIFYIYIKLSYCKIYLTILVQISASIA